MTTITSRLGKHKKCRGQTVDDDDDNDCHTSRLIENDTTPPCHDGGDVCMPRKKLRTEFEKAANVKHTHTHSLSLCFWVCVYLVHTMHGVFFIMCCMYRSQMLVRLVYLLRESVLERKKEDPYQRDILYSLLLRR